MCVLYVSYMCLMGVLHVSLQPYFPFAHQNFSRLKLPLRRDSCNAREWRDGSYQPFAHLECEDGVVVAPSNVPGAGLGLFTSREFVHGERVCYYSGECLKCVEGDLSKYLLEYQWKNCIGVYETWYLDSAKNKKDKVWTTAARYINDPCSTYGTYMTHL